MSSSTYSKLDFHSIIPPKDLSLKPPMTFIDKYFSIILAVLNAVVTFPFLKYSSCVPGFYFSKPSISLYKAISLAELSSSPLYFNHCTCLVLETFLFSFTLL